MTSLASSRRRHVLPAWRRWFPVIAGILLLLLAPVLCYAQGAGADSVTLAWTAPGDDGNVGTATAYEMRRSLSPINAGNWSTATVVPGMPAPLAPGTRQTAVARGLTRGTTYYFAIRTVDDAGNWSGISNVFRWDWVFDSAPPAPPTGLVATRQGEDVRVRWQPNSEPDVAGYIVYRAETNPGTRSRITGTIVTGTEFVDSNVPQGAETLWYEVSAIDESGNESARSSTYAISLVEAALAWKMETGFPNPSSLASPVNIPVAIPASGAASAVIDIVDAGGHRVRRIDLSGLGTGSQIVVWDGKNDAGREVAPGIYRAWLIAGSTRQTTRLVRVP